MDETTRTLGDRYEVGDVLGRGGMAEVHLGRDSRLGRTVAIKVLRADMARDPVFHARFRREAQSAAGMNHPSIVAVYDTGEDVRVESGGTSVKLPYIVMEHVAGRTVRDVLVAAGGSGVGTERAVAITAGVLTALDYSHRHGIVHRDIKPANVMVTPTGDVKVMDFGIARAVADSSITMTQTSAVIGTAQYLSPEQARGQVVDARSDLYSAGCLLYELLTGRPPFVGDSAVSVAYQHVREIPVPPSGFNPAVAEAMDRVVLKALAKDREDRYAGAEEFREDLLAAGAGHQVMAPAVAVAATTQVVPTTTEATRALAAAGFSVGSAATVARGWADDDTGLHTGPGRLDHRDGAADEDGFDDVFSPTTSGRQGAVGTSWEAERSGATRAGGGGRDGLGGQHGQGQHRRRRWAVIVPLVVLLLLAAGAGTWGVLAVVGRVVVPDVTDRTVAQATTTLKAVDLGVTQHTEANAAAAGTVVAQDPKGGTRAVKGDVVDLTVSSGPSSVSVPDLTNKTEAQAAAALARVGLTEGEAKTQDDPGTPAGRVVSSDPTAGTAVTPSSQVNLVLSSGKVTVPDLTGKTSAEAQQALTDLQLKPFLTQTVRSDRPAGTVVAQSPASGLVDPGDSVTLIIAVPPAATATPTATPTPSSATPTPEPTAPSSPSAQPSPTATDDDPSESPAPSSTAAGDRVGPSTAAAGETAASAADLRAAD